VIVVNPRCNTRTRWSQTEAVPGVAGELWRLADEFGEHTDARVSLTYYDRLKSLEDESAARLKSPGVQPEYY